MTPPAAPLAGRRVVVTRPRPQAPALAARLSALGAEPILFPTIAIAPLDDTTALDAALRRLPEFDWVVFTSANAVDMASRRLSALGLEGALGRGPARMAAIGPATARALEALGAAVTALPDEYVAEALPDTLGAVAGQRVLLPQAELARDVLAAELARRGALVEALPAYRTLPPAPDPAGLAALRQGVDALTFTSTSAVVNFVRLVSGGDRYVEPAEQPRSVPAGPPLPSLAGVAVACIGPITAQAARAAGLPVSVVPAAYTLDGLVDALAGHFARPAPRLEET
jgi:uroporphyrinogen-III synthase